MSDCHAYAEDQLGRTERCEHNALLKETGSAEALSFPFVMENDDRIRDCQNKSVAVPDSSTCSENQHSVLQKKHICKVCFKEQTIT